MGPLELLFGIPEHAIVQEGFGVLHLVSGPGGISIHSVAIRSLDVDFVLLPMLNTRSAIGVGRNDTVEAAEFVLSYPELLSIPAIEITED